MLKEIYSRVRSGKGSAEAEPSEKYRSITEEEYQRFLFEDELYQQIVETEAALHNLEDPLEIAIGVMKAACGLYDADWSGILIVDLHSQLWRPEIWYDVHSGPMKETHFHELELTEEFVTWVQHLSEQTPLVIQDTESIRKDHPKEYEAYQRLGTRSVIGVPFGQHPLGFMVVRNPKRNIEKYQPLQVACFVAMMMLEHKRQLEAERRILLRETPDAPDDGKLWIRYNILGPHSLTVNGMTISEQDLQHPNRRAWILLLYLILHRTTVDQGTIAAENWPDESAKSAKNNIR